MDYTDLQFDENLKVNSKSNNKDYGSSYIQTPSQIGSDAVGSQSLGNDWASRWSKSLSYRPQSYGYYLNGRRGTAEFNDISGGAGNFLADKTGFYLYDGSGNSVFYTLFSGTNIGDVRIGSANAYYFYDKSSDIITFQSESSGSRCVLANNGVMTFYDDNGSVTSINAASNAISISPDAASDLRGLYIIQNNTTGTSEALRINIKGNQQAFKIDNNNNNLQDKALVDISLSSTHASRLSTSPMVLLTNSGNGRTLSIFSASGSNGQSIYIDHTNSSSPIRIYNNTNTETSFKRLVNFHGTRLLKAKDGGATIDGALTGTVGDICMNGIPIVGYEGIPHYCYKTGTNWAPIGTCPCFGGIYGDNISQSVTISVQGTETQITGGLSAMTGYDVSASTYELTVNKPGKYLINWSLSLFTGTANEELEGGIMINQTRIAEGSSHSETSSASRPMTISGTAIKTLTDGSDIGLFVTNQSSTNNITIHHASLTAMALMIAT